MFNMVLDVGGKIVGIFLSRRYEIVKIFSFYYNINQCVLLSKVVRFVNEILEGLSSQNRIWKLNGKYELIKEKS